MIRMPMPAQKAPSRMAGYVVRRHHGAEIADIDDEIAPASSRATRVDTSAETTTGVSETIV
jgi:hypothetical protein